jgi:hypothetical protein
MLQGNIKNNNIKRMDKKMEKYKGNHDNHLQQAGNEYYEYLKKMRKDNAEDAAEYPASFMTF